jgi:glycosyltransferase involved in cell wall biosynthesis
MNGLPSVSVVVPVLNGAAVIGDLIAALLGQVGAPRAREIIIVDNGSWDGTRDIVRRHGVTLLEEPKRGPAAARNRGLAHARGEVIAYLDADTLPTRRWLAELVAPFSDPEVILATGRTISYRPQTGAERFVAQKGFYETEERSMAFLTFPFVASRNMAVRREHSLAVGGWAEDMPSAEDVDFCYRLLRRYPSAIVFRPTALLFHRERATDDGLRRQAWSYGEGRAHMYLRYPEVVHWNWLKSMLVAWGLMVRSTWPVVQRMGRVMGLVSADLVEFATYNRMWTWWYWRGFFSMLRHKERRKP